MKKVLLIIIIITFGLITKAQDNEINWMTFSEALTAQKENPKKIMMDVYANWCGPCKLLDKNTFHNLNLVKYVNENFYAVKFNGESKESITYQGQEYGNPHYDKTKEFTHNSSHQLADFLQVRAYPSILFFENDGSLLAPLPGYRTAKQLEVFLKLFKTDKYKEINTEEAFSKYQKDFVYEFTE
jgi:thioredoxin-related protein